MWLGCRAAVAERAPPVAAVADPDGCCWVVPFTYSTDGGASFAKGSTGKGFKLPFPALGGNQRPCVHRLLSGNLVFVGTHHPPPKAASMTT